MFVCICNIFNQLLNQNFLFYKFWLPISHWPWLFLILRIGLVCINCLIICRLGTATLFLNTNIQYLGNGFFLFYISGVLHFVAGSSVNTIGKNTNILRMIQAVIK